MSHPNSRLRWQIPLLIILTLPWVCIGLYGWLERVEEQARAAELNAYQKERDSWTTLFAKFIDPDSADPIIVAVRRKMNNDLPDRLHVDYTIHGKRETSVNWGIICYRGTTIKLYRSSDNNQLCEDGRWSPKTPNEIIEGATEIHVYGGPNQ